MLSSTATAYLCEWTNSSRRNVIDCLSKLLDKQSIIKVEDNAQKKKPNSYKINEMIFHKTCEESSQALMKKVHKTCEESSHNNNIINTNDNTIYKCYYYSGGKLP